MGKTKRLDRVLSNSGYGTRKDVKKLIKEGAVKVNGEVASDSGMHIDPENCSIEVNGEALNYRKYIYVMMNKPQGVVSATYDGKYQTVTDLLPEELKNYRLFPVGRLDIDTEGLILMTNNGQLAHDLMSPKKHVPKTYYAFVSGSVNENDVARFAEGVTLDDGYKTLPARLTVLRSGNYSEIELVIYEGKYHQVKRMFEAIGKRVKYLRRIAMGNLKLDEDLKPGKCRELTENEIELLLSTAGLN